MFEFRVKRHAGDGGVPVPYRRAPVFPLFSLERRKPALSCIPIRAESLGPVDREERGSLGPGEPERSEA